MRVKPEVRYSTSPLVQWGPCSSLILHAKLGVGAGEEKEENVPKLNFLTPTFQTLLLPPLASQAFLPGATPRKSPFLEKKGIDMAQQEA